MDWHGAHICTQMSGCLMPTQRYLYVFACIFTARLCARMCEKEAKKDMFLNVRLHKVCVSLTWISWRLAYQ